MKYTMKIGRSKFIHAITLIGLFLFCYSLSINRIILLLPIYSPSRLEKKPEVPQLLRIHSNETIHLAFVLTERQSIIRFIDMLKSLLYYQARISSSELSCRPAVLHVVRQYFCTNLTQIIQHRIKLHLVTDAGAQNLLRQYVQEDAIPDLEMRFYSYESVVRYVQGIPNVHAAGIAAMVKIAVPEIIDQEIERIILLDTDMLFNHNIAGLWAEFSSFVGNQTFGGVLVQNDIHARFFQEIGFPIFLNRGINTGLLMIHLKRLRSFDWHHLWVTHLHSFLQRKTRLIAADQDIFNAVFGRRPDLVHTVPCLWNVQLILQSNPDYCPVVWTKHYFYEADCGPHILTTNVGGQNPLGQVYLAHFSGEGKPTGGPMNWTYIEDRDELLWRQMSTNELRLSFTRAYAAFDAMPIDCFTNLHMK